MNSSYKQSIRLTSLFHILGVNSKKDNQKHCVYRKMDKLVYFALWRTNFVTRETVPVNSFIQSEKKKQMKVLQLKLSGYTDILNGQKENNHIFCVECIPDVQRITIHNNGMKRKKMTKNCPFSKISVCLRS